MAKSRATATRTDTTTTRADEAHDARLAALKCIAAALAGVVRADTEVIVHDLRMPERSIAAIVNGHVSNRREGQPIIAGLFGDRAFDAVISDIATGEPNGTRLIDRYEAHTQDGRTLSSSSVIFFDEQARPAAALCMNVDPGALDQIRRALDSLTRPPAAREPVASEATIDELVAEIIAGALQSFDVPVSRLSKREKVAAVRTMHERGLFSLRGSAEMVAKSLGATKFTIYNYLDEIGRERDGGAS